MSSNVALAERIATDLSETLHRAEAAIASLTDDKDHHRLAEVRSQADAHRLYEERAGAEDRARTFAHIKLLAEAGLGALSFEDYPTLSVKAYPKGVKIGPEKVPVVTAKRWRILANAQERGVLVGVIADLSEAGEALGTHNVAEACSRRGASGVPGTAVAKKVKKEAWARGVSVQELAAQIGFNPSTLYTPGRVMRWQTAKAVAEALDLNPLGFPLAARKRAKPRGVHKWLKRERKTMGGRWDETYSLFRKCVAEFAEIAGEDTRWDDAYAHFYALEEIIGRAMKREALEGKKSA